MMELILIEKIPEVLINNIFSYISYANLYNVNKLYYNNYHNIIIKNIINKKNVENFNRLIIRKDYNFIFEYLLEENGKKWISMKKYYYKNKIYSNYLMFIFNYSIENNSIKIKNILMDYFEKIGLTKNLHKKNIIRYIKYSICKI